MKLSNFKGKKVLIMGLGLLGGGIGVARFFAKHGAVVTVTDLKTSQKLSPSVRKLKGLPIRYVLGGHREKDFKTSDIIIKNPDVLPDSPYLKIARRHSIPIEMAESFFVKNCKSPIIGVTGTRGKTTTASLISKMLKDAGYLTALAGNVADTSTLTFLDKITPRTWVVLELSSFQLHGFAESKISPHIAVITNIYPEHLNHYKTFKDYIEDKKNIFRFQNKNDFLVINKNNKYLKQFAKEAKSKSLLFDSKDVPVSWNLKLKGIHNRENVAAALAVGKILKIQPSIIKKSITGFNPLPYHLELVRKINGINFVNDGVSTSPETTIAAINSLDRPLLLILGGNDKLLDFAQLGKVVDSRIKGVFLMKGTATDKIKNTISKKKIIRGVFNTLKDTISSCYMSAKRGDVVLFSPAATSFNWFENIYQRSAEFEKIVREL